MRSLFLFSLLLVPVAPVLAQTKPAPAKPGATPQKFTAEGPKRQVLSQNSFRLEGFPNNPAHLNLPGQLDVTALTIIFDFEGNKITRVRGFGGVNLKTDLVSNTPNAPKTHIESVSQEATLTVDTRTLVLTKNLNGFYQIDNGPKNTLSGDSATLNYLNAELVADIRGGDRGVKVTVPAESLGRPDDLGVVTVTSENAKINQKTGIATFTGNAHAVGTGPNAFDVTADEFILARNSTDNTISTLTTRGRTLVKLDLPPDAAASATATTPVTATTPGGSKTTSSIGRPTHIEVNSDNAVVDRATSTVTFNGNVKGFYRLQPPTGTEQTYNFTGDQAIIRYDPTKGNAQNGLNVEISNAKIDAPNFNLGF